MLDSSDIQMRRWAAHRFGIDADKISFIQVDTWASEPYGCSTSVSLPHVEQTIRVYMKPNEDKSVASTHFATFTDAFAMIRELTADYDA